MKPHPLAFFQSSNVQLVLFLWVLLLQWGLFQSFILGEIVWGYPTHHDQTAYLLDSYALHEAIRRDGLSKATAQFVQYRIPAQGFLLVYEAALFYFVAGASRASALLLNFLHYLAFQIFAFWAVRKLTQSWTNAWIGLGLILSVRTLFYEAGGIADFRLDFAGFCLFGVYLGSVLYSRIFASRKWAMVSSGIALILILTRFISTLYVFGLLFAFGLTLLGLSFFWKERQNAFRSRVKNILLSSGILVFGAAPFFWFARKSIYAYYFVSHLSDSEQKIRIQEVGIFQWFQHLTFYPRSLFYDHLGKGTVYYMGGLWILLIGVFLFLKKRRVQRAEPRGVLPFFETGLFLIFSVLVPFGILTLNLHKSRVVIDILVAPSIWIFLFLFIFTLRRLESYSNLWKLLPLLTALMLGIDRQWSGYTGNGPFYHSKRDTRQVVQMYEALSAYCMQTGNLTPAYSVNHINDYLGNNIFSCIAYEHLGVLLRVTGKLGHSIFEISKEESFRFLDESDIVVLTDRTEDVLAPFPFFDSMKKQRQEINQKVAADFSLFKTYRLHSTRLRAYVRHK